MLAVLHAVHKYNSNVMLSLLHYLRSIRPPLAADMSERLELTLGLCLKNMNNHNENVDASHLSRR